LSEMRLGEMLRHQKIYHHIISLRNSKFVTISPGDLNSYRVNEHRTHVLQIFLTLTPCSGRHATTMFLLQ